MKTKILIPFAITSLILSALITFRSNISHYFFQPTESELKTVINEIKPQELADQETELIKVVAENLEVPWKINFLPEDTLLVTERRGAIKLINETVTQINLYDVEDGGEGGLLGAAIHPDFKENRFVYFYSTSSSNGKEANSVDRYKLVGHQLQDKTTIIADIPGALFHNGGQIEFGPDGLLYIGTGDARQPNLAQDTNSLAGKILRVNDDGSIPNSNPFGNEVYSYGHRNVQGLAWDSSGKLWATEHGPSGNDSGFDEVNIITSGGNYGWPNYKGTESADGILPAIVSSGADETWAPNDIEFANGNLYFTGLRGESIYKVLLDENFNFKEITRHLPEQFGRIRAISLGPDNYLYFGTSNTDGRGIKQSNDDHVYKIDPLNIL